VSTGLDTRHGGGRLSASVHVLVRGRADGAAYPGHEGIAGDGIKIKWLINAGTPIDPDPERSLSIREMIAPARSLPWTAALLLALVASGTALDAMAVEPKRVLLLHSFGRDVEPYATVAAVFRRELANGKSQPIAVYEVALDAVHTISAEDDAPFVELLRHRFSDATPDIVVTFGPSAAHFFLRNRDQVFPRTPMLMAAVDERIAHASQLRPGDAAVVGKLDLSRQVDNILQLLPETRTIAVVIGNSPLEKFWLGELQKEFASFNGRLTFIWLNGQSFEQVLTRVSSLPARTAVFYTLFAVDTAGVPFEDQDALIRLHEVSTAPVFGVFEDVLGHGVVGGPYSPQRKAGALTAAVALRMLNDLPAAEPMISVMGFEPPVYDWRELKRWGIDAARLPAGSAVRFRPPTLWEEHRVLIGGGISVLVLQTALTVALLRQRISRRRAEEEALTLSGRLIDAHEDERRWLARELHDDITQRLAGLAIDAAKLPGDDLSSSDIDARHSIRGGLAQLSEDIHDLSYRLHPSVLDDLGLVEALKAECDRVARSESVRVDVEADKLPSSLPREAALCLYRVAQEALRNIVRHAKASSAQLSLSLGGGGLRLAVRDNGRGYDPGSQPSGHSLGHASMRERLRLLGGQLEIETGPGRGTTVIAWVPIPEAPA
jgi:signal transduction histidine kinase